MKTLSIIIPVYNEESRLVKTFQALSELRLPRGLKLEEVIFVNDGSRDKTELRIKNYELRIKNKIPIRIISYKKNQGKGYAISRGMKVSGSDYTLFCDADMSTHINEIKKMMPFIRKNVPVIIGTRKNGHSTVIRHQPILRELVGKGFTWLSNVILNTWVTDFTCGFKVFSKESKDVLFSMTKIKGWAFDAEVMFLGRLSGYEVQEVPVVWSDDRRSKVSIGRDIIESFTDLLKIRKLHIFSEYKNVPSYRLPSLSVNALNSIKSFFL